MKARACKYLFLSLPILALLILPGQGAEPPTPPTVSVEADGKVLARPDMATLTLEVETQDPQAQAAAQENAGRADNLLKALKKVVGAEGQIKTLSFRLLPVYAPKDKNQAAVIKAYRAINRLQVELKDLARLGATIDAAWKNGASQISGPYWEYSRLEELQQEAAVDALGKTRRLAEALAQAAGLKIKGVERIVTGIHPLPMRAAPREAFLAAAGAPAPTPVELGEEEIKAHIQAVYQLGP